VGGVLEVGSGEGGGAVVEVVPPGEAAALAVLRPYWREVASRYYARPVTDAEVEQYMLDDPSDELAPPTGLFLLARAHAEPVGCAGLELLPGGVGEVKRVYVAHRARGHGLGRLLMGELERQARAHAVRLLRLDTRKDLVEARALYAAVGYREVPAFNAGPFAEVWFAKTLT
jgi:GNAT superfamily N-acetyltransferase